MYLLQPVHESLPSVRNGTIDDVLDVLISSGGLISFASLFYLQHLSVVNHSRYLLFDLIIIIIIIMLILIMMTFLMCSSVVEVSDTVSSLFYCCLI